jgi:hypothetical protein
MSQFSSVFRGHSDTTDLTDPSYALRVLSVPNNALCIVVTTLQGSTLLHLTAAP